tara:strand:+ start:745 stop:927 length:183 start_codon:yes stop_codon:yes gene_type:complete
MKNKPNKFDWTASVVVGIMIGSLHYSSEGIFIYSAITSVVFALIMKLVILKMVWEGLNEE